MTDPLFDITPFLTQAEGQHFDRKSMFEGPPGAKRPRKRGKVREQAAEYVAAFANADGGVLVLGIEDDGTVTGHSVPPKPMSLLLSAPQALLDPPQPAGFVVAHQGRELIVFDVPAADIPVQMTGNGFPLRVGDQTVRARESLIAASKQQGMHESWECRRSQCTLADLDPELLAQARAGAGLSAWTDEEYLLRRKLADRTGHQTVLRRAAELLFARHEPDHPNAGIRVFRVIGTERRFGVEHNVEERPRIEGSLPKVLDEARSAVGSLLRRPSRLLGVRFQEMPEYPDFAWREAVHNAVAHRDYAIQGAGTEIWMFENRMEVVSAGAFPEGVTLEEVLRLERVHRSRNPRIVRVLVDLGFAKDQGEGIPRMFAEMEDAFLPRPDVKVTESQVVVTLRNTSTLTDSDRRFVAGLGDTELSRHEFRALLMAHRHEQVDNVRLRAATGLDTLGASQLLRGLRDRELLTLHSHGAASYYTVSPALCEQIGQRSGADRGELEERIDDTSARIEGSSGADRGELGSDRGELPADVRSMIDRLGSRPRKERLRSSIEAVCAAREWTTSGEIARFLRFSQRNLSSRHLTPMVEAGQLARRYPDSPNHPAQAYRATRVRPVPPSAEVDPQNLGPPSKPMSWVKNAPFQCLGYNRGRYYYLPRSTGRVVHLLPSAHTRSRLLTLAPLEWWEDHFPDLKPRDWSPAVDAVFRESQRAGVFDEDTIRGRGCWRRENGVLVHLGDRLYPPGESGSVDPLTYHAENRVYERSARIIGPSATHPLDSGSAESLLGLFTEMEWEDDLSGYLLAGWTVLAPFCGALSWRPHVWLAEDDGHPTTAIVNDLVEPLLAGAGIRFGGASSAANVLRRLRRDTLPILYGSPTATRRYIPDILQLAHTASSSTGLIAKGTGSGWPVTYRMRSMFCFSGMKVGKLRPDRSRISILRLQQPQAGGRRAAAQPWRDRSGELGDIKPHLGSRLLARTMPWLRDGRLDALIAVCRDAARTVLGDARKGDQCGTLVAGAWLLLTDSVPPQDEVSKWLRERVR